jgi:hypothetical protein
MVSVAAAPATLKVTIEPETTRLPLEIDDPMFCETGFVEA